MKRMVLVVSARLVKMMSRKGRLQYVRIRPMEALRLGVWDNWEK
jgi:hypothetical protein